MNRGARAAVLVAVIALAGCSGSDSNDPPAQPDYSASFAGRWDGISDITLAGESVSSPGAYVRITRLGVNSINVGEVCDDGTGPSAEVISGTSFRIAGHTCPPVPVTGCSSVALVVAQGGTGTLANGQLTISITGSATGCGQSFPLSLTFNGSKTSTNPQALTVENDSDTLSGAIKAAVAAYF